MFVEQKQWGDAGAMKGTRSTLNRLTLRKEWRHQPRVVPLDSNVDTFYERDQGGCCVGATPREGLSNAEHSRNCCQLQQQIDVCLGEGSRFAPAEQIEAPI